MILRHTNNLYHPEEAEKVAEELQKNDDEWTYKVVHDPKGTGYSFIEIYDEEGEYVERY